jgi:hypothetical protein
MREILALFTALRQLEEGLGLLVFEGPLPLARRLTHQGKLSPLRVSLTTHQSLNDPIEAKSSLSLNQRENFHRNYRSIPSWGSWGAESPPEWRSIKSREWNQQQWCQIIDSFEREARESRERRRSSEQWHNQQRQHTLQRSENWHCRDSREKQLALDHRERKWTPRMEILAEGGQERERRGRGGETEEDGLVRWGGDGGSSFCRIDLVREEGVEMEVEVVLFSDHQ